MLVLSFSINDRFLLVKRMSYFVINFCTCYTFHIKYWANGNPLHLRKHINIKYKDPNTNTNKRTTSKHKTPVRKVVTVSTNIVPIIPAQHLLSYLDRQNSLFTTHKTRLANGYREDWREAQDSGFRQIQPRFYPLVNITLVPKQGDRRNNCVFDTRNRYITDGRRHIITWWISEPNHYTGCSFFFE